MVISGNCVLVTPKGLDTHGCLDYSSRMPCKTIDYPIERGYTTLCIDGTFDNISETLGLLNLVKVKESNLTIFCQMCEIENTDIFLSCKRDKMCRVQLGMIYC